MRRKIWYKKEVNNNRFLCEICKKEVTKNNWSRHQNSDLHQLVENKFFNNTPTLFQIESGLEDFDLNSDDNEFTLTETAKNGWFSTYIYTPREREETRDWLLFLNSIKPRMEQLLKKLLASNSISYQMIMKAQLYKETDINDIITNYFTNEKRQIILNKTDISKSLTRQINRIDNKVEEFLRNGSGWVFDKVLFVEIRISKYQPLKGQKYVELPKWIKDKHCIRNVKNDDNKCHMWAILSLTHPATEHVDRVTKYKDYADELNYDGIEFPVNVHDNDKFENQNDLAIFIYYIKNENDKSIKPLRISRKNVKREKRIRLFLYNEHYSGIINFDGLLHNQNKYKGRMHFCDFCLSPFVSETARNNHETICIDHKVPQVVKLPEPGQNLYKFNNFQYKLKAPFVIYADFEAMKILITESDELNRQRKKNEENKTKYLAKQEPYSFNYVVIRSDGLLLSEKFYEGPDSAKELVNSLKLEAVNIEKSMKDIEPLQMTKLDWETYNKAAKCHICEQEFKSDEYKVRDHCHITGSFRGAAHNKCNRSFRFSPRIPVFFHNLTGYDGHIIMQGLTADDKIEVIPNNIEKYMSIRINNVNKSGCSLVFKDSLQFLSAELDKIVKSTPRDAFKITKQKFGDKTDLMLRKGVFPYNYMDSWDKLKETRLPTDEECYYNDFKLEGITGEELNHALQVYDKFDCKTISDYSKLYNCQDVYLLADAFEYFRNNMLDFHKLDPAHYLSLPHFSNDCSLLNLNKKVELLTDIDMYLLMEKGIRGGVSVCSKRYAKSNPKYKYVNGKKENYEGYDPSKPPSYIVYQDANNLYPWAMSQNIPQKSFRWVPEQEFDSMVTKLMSHPPDAKTGYIIKCDLKYPNRVKKLHYDYPLAPENIIVTDDMLSPTQLGLMKKNENKIAANVKKLAPNVMDKKNYVCHYRNLQFYLKNGLEIEKIHSIIEFEQSPWMKSYIDKNTERRKVCTTDIEKDFYKLLNNAVFGKTMENVRKRRNVKIVEDDKKAKWTSSPRFQNQNIINDLVAIEMVKTEIKLNKPIFVGLTVLELSKLLMFEFYYDHIKKSYGDKAQLLYTDTDSFIIHIETEDIYDNMKVYADLYDLSEYPKDHPHYSEKNKKVPGKMKDELKGELILEFVGLRSKMYSVLTERQDKEKDPKKAKGIAKGVVKKVLTHEMYKESVLEGNQRTDTMKRIISEKHQLYIQELNKISLNPLDTKRWICEDRISTRPFGFVQKLLSLLDNS